MREIERRFIDSQLELRVEESGKKKKLVGYAAKWGVRSVDLGGFVEEIAPSCFDEALASGDDVLARAEHDSRMLLGRRSSGTLRLSVDAVGLRYEVDLPNTSVGNDIGVLCERGDLKQSSFAFVVESRDDEEWSKTAGGTPLRVLKRAALIDVAPVASPAYPQTTVSARALEEARGIMEQQTKLEEEALRQRALGRMLAIAPAADKREQSYEDRMNAIYAGLRKLLGSPWESENAWWMIEATFEDRVIVERFDGARQLWLYPMTFDAGGVPTFGEAVRVEEQYVAVAASAPGEGEASAEARQETPEPAPDLEMERLRGELIGA